MKTNYYKVNLKNNLIETPDKNERNIIFEGMATLFDQEGFYVALNSIGGYLSQGFEISWLNVVRDLQRKSWSGRSIISTLKELNSYISFNNINIEKIQHFLQIDYHSQCEMLFQFHFNGDRLEAEEWLESLLVKK